MENVEQLMERFAALPFAIIGLGPRHPVVPKEILEAEAVEFLRRHPFLERDPDYVSFLKTCEAAGIYYPDKSPDYYSLTIFGMGDWRDGFAEPIDPEGYYAFAVTQTHAFGFDAIGIREIGVYKKLVEIGHPTLGTFEHAYDSFRQWLVDVLAKNGRI